MDLASDKTKCRVCLIDNQSQLFSWTTVIELALFEGITYLECFQKCTRLEVYADDDLPQALCFQCATQLCDAYEFIKKASFTHHSLLIKQEEKSLNDEEQGITTSFEWEAVQKKDETLKNSDCTVETIVKTSSVHNYAANYSSSDGTVDCYPLSPETDKKEVSFVSKKKFKRKSRDGSNKVSSYNVKRTSRIKIRKQKPICADKKEKPYKQTEHNNLEASINCEFCDKPFPRIKMRGHVKRVHNVTMLLCHACPRTFKNAYNLNQHALTHDTNRQLSFTCEKCGKKFLSRTGFRNHAKTHESNRQAVYECEQCDKQFFQKGSLKTHMIMHTGEMLNCKICDKRYRRETDLKNHMRSHTGDTPYKCRYCVRAYTTDWALKRHELQHEGFSCICKICGKEYKSLTGFSKHKLTHMGITMKCSICGMGFNEKYRMKRHIAGVHKIELKNTEELIQKVKTKCEYRGLIKYKT